MNVLNRFLVSIMTLIFALSLTSCSAIGTASKKQDLKLQTKLTETIFLDPVAPEKRTVYIQVRSSTDTQSFNIKPDVMAALITKGYTVTENPDEAHYWLQANVRYVGAPEGKEFEDAMSGTGAVIQGAIAGAAISSATGGDGSDNAKAAILLAAIGYAADAMVDDVYHTSITDIQLSEQVDGIVTTNSKHNLQQGESGSDTQVISEKSDRKKYQTRVLVTANQANMIIEEGEKAMKEKLTSVISGLF